MKPFRASLPILVPSRHVFNTVTEYTLLRITALYLTTFLWGWIHGCCQTSSYELLGSGLGGKNLFTWCQHWVAAKCKHRWYIPQQSRRGKRRGGGQGNKEVTDKKKHGMLMAHLGCDFFFLFIYFDDVICSFLLNLYFDELIQKPSLSHAK